MDWWRPELFLPLLGALAAGCAIGFEREYRARAAGFRTHALVALTSALLMVAAQHQMEWGGSTIPESAVRIDPARMAHGILTGIGFLCGGVIFREGASVHGLTTAASLWITSSIGMLFGVGFYGLAAAGTLATIMVLSVFRAIDRIIPAETVADLVVAYRPGEAPAAAAWRDEVERHDLSVKRLAQRRLDDGGLEYAAVVRSKGPMRSEGLIADLDADPRLARYALEPRT